MVKVGDTIYYVVYNEVFEGKINYIEGDIFHIEGIAGCSGPHEFNISMLNQTIFLNKEDANRNKDIPFVQLELMC